MVAEIFHYQYFEVVFQFVSSYIGGHLHFMQGRLILIFFSLLPLVHAQWFSNPGSTNIFLRICPAFYHQVKPGHKFEIVVVSTIRWTPSAPQEIKKQVLYTLVFSLEFD